MAEEVKKLTPEELDMVKKVRNKYQEITIQLGQIQVQRLQMMAQLKTLEDLEQDLQKQYVDNQDNETKSINEVNRRLKTHKIKFFLQENRKCFTV